MSTGIGSDEGTKGEGRQFRSKFSHPYSERRHKTGMAQDCRNFGFSRGSNSVNLSCIFSPCSIFRLLTAKCPGFFCYILCVCVCVCQAPLPWLHFCLLKYIKTLGNRLCWRAHGCPTFCMYVALRDEDCALKAFFSNFTPSFRESPDIFRGCTVAV